MELNYPADKGFYRSRGSRHDSHKLMWAVVRRIAAETGDVKVVELFVTVELYT